MDLGEWVLIELYRAVMRRREEKKKEKLQLGKSMDWEWRKFAWDETENLTEERINDTLLVGSEKKIKKVEIQVGNGVNNSEEKLKKRVSRTRVVPSSRSPKRDSNLTCLVDCCKADLSNCKDYHRRHRVCERHSKIPVVLVRGEEQRFCQQCSRFHSLGEFDEVKRSCRKRLDGHNRRRRKPQPESIYLTPKDFLSNFKGPRILQFSSSQLNMPDLDAKIALAPCFWKTEAEAIVDNSRIPAIDWKTTPNPSAAHICHVGDKQFSLKQTNNQKDINQSTPQISPCNPLPLAIASPERGRGSHGVSQPVNSGCALYLLSSSPSQASGLGLSCYDLPQEYYYAYSRESTSIPQDTVFQTRGSDGSFKGELSPSLLTSWE